VKLTSEQLRDKLRDNPALAKLNPDLAGGAPRSQPQQTVRHEPVAAVPRKDGNSTRYAVRICSFRRRLLDPDNLCGKFFVDCLRRGGIIPDDTAAIMDYGIRQQKVKSKKEEHTEIVIERLT